MIAAPKVRKSNIQLSDDFFKIVFNDEFIFSDFRSTTAQQILNGSSLSEEEKKFALRIHRSDLYSHATQQQCIDLCNQLAGVFHWQSNSEGPWIFTSKIWYFLLAQDKDLEWFKQRMLGKKTKSIRATIITRTPEGILLVKDHKGFWLLPGGSLKRGELPISAACRELYEETQLNAQQICFLFEFESEHYLHHVFEVSHYLGTPKARDDAKALSYFSTEEIQQQLLPSTTSFSHANILLKYGILSSSSR